MSDVSLMSVVEQQCQSILLACKSPPTAVRDTIRECELGDKDVIDCVEELFQLANDRIHVFPFRDVKPCWLSLYTETSIIKAVNLMHERMSDMSPQSTPSLDWVDDLACILDMALITAGGYGREDLIHSLFDTIQTVLEEENHPTKRRKLSHRHEDTLVPNSTTCPKIQSPATRICSPSMEAFAKHMNHIKEPCILTDTINHWPALQLWKTRSYWLDNTLGGRRLVPIETGRSYVDDDFAQEIIPFRSFLDRYISRHKPEGQSQDDQKSEEEHRTGYLAQHDLLWQIPNLRKDVAIPDYCYLEPPPPDGDTPVALSLANKERLKKVNLEERLPVKDHGDHPNPMESKAGNGSSESISLGLKPLSPALSGSPHCASSTNQESHDKPIQCNVWFGPSATVSPLHHDPYHNILCQVVGTKYVRLYSPHDSHRLSPRSDAEAAPHIISSNTHKGGSSGNSDSGWEGHEAEMTTNAAADSPSQSPAAGIDNSATIDMSNTSAIDLTQILLSPAEDWDDMYPGFSSIPYFEGILRPGDALYIPIGWWHYVRSCETAISVNFWWT